MRREISNFFGEDEPDNWEGKTPMKLVEDDDIQVWDENKASIEDWGWDTPNMDKFLRDVEDKVDRDLFKNSYDKNDCCKSLVHRLWTKIKIFGKKLRPGGIHFVMEFWETPDENIGGVMQRNNRNIKRGKISNRRNVNRNNVNIPKKKKTRVSL